MNSWWYGYTSAQEVTFLKGNPPRWWMDAGDDNMEEGVYCG